MKEVFMANQMNIYQCGNNQASSVIYSL